jgi:tetratricopeptide (TPR) repeat protein
MKDPLQSEQTPYEVLELERGASDADIDQAFKQGLVKRGNVQKLMAARNALQRPAERVLLDLFQYDPQVASRLNPNPLADRSVLELAGRQETAAAWEKQLEADFPDLGIVHSLGVLWYWWVLHLEGQPGFGGTPSLEEGWLRVIAYWAMLVGTEQFWSAQGAAGEELASSVRAQVLERLRNNLSDLGQRYRDHRDETGVDRCQRLELLLTTEVRTAKEAASVGLRTAQGRFACGLLMLEQMGLLEPVEQQLQSALEKNPADEKLLALRNALSPYAPIAALIDSNKPEAALEALAAREKERISRLAHSFWEQRGRTGGSADSDWRRAEREFGDKPEGKELSILRARAFHCLAKQQASLDKLEDALSSWERALKCPPDAELKSHILAEIVSNCQARAAALQQREPETAIAILEMGLQLTPDEKLRSLLAEILAQRSIQTYNEVQEKAKQGKVTRQIVTDCEAALANLEKASKLGSKRATENLPIARRVLEALKAMLTGPPLPPPPPPLPDNVARLVQEAGQAAAKEDWDTAIAKLRQATKLAGSKPPEVLKKNLATSLANRAVGNANRAVEMLADAAKAHGPGLSELFKSLQSQGLLRSSDECTFCGKSKYSSQGESWYGYELPDGRKVSLCGKCGSMAQDTFGSAPKPSPEAISLLQSAERDLSEAATLDPSSDHVRKNLSSAREILSKLGSVAPSISKASRQASGERNNFHAALVMLILVLSCIVPFMSGEEHTQHGTAMWLDIWLGKSATILAWVIALPFFLCASTGHIDLWWDGLCKKRWKRKGGFAKFMEFLVFMFLISLILTFLAGKLR